MLKRRWLPVALAGASLAVCATGSAGSVGRAYSLVLQPNGKIVVAGWGERGSRIAPGLARYTPDGSLDTSFGFRGKALAQSGLGYANALALQPDGKLITTGVVASGRADAGFGIARYTSSGNLDPTFGVDGHVIEPGTGAYAKAVAIQPDGRIVVAGLGSEGIALARYDPDGTREWAVETEISDLVVSGVALQPDGKIVVAGTLDGDNGEEFVVVRYRSDGSLDLSFGSAGIATTQLTGRAQGRAVVLQTDGKIVVAGWVETDPVGPGYKFALVRYNADGSLDSTFGSGGVVTTPIGNIIAADLPYGGGANAVAIQPDGNIVAGGANLVPWPGRGNFAVVRYLPDGSLDSSFGDGGKVTTSFGYAPPENPTEDGDVATGLAVQPDGKIVAGGYSQFGPHTEQYAVALARYNPDGSLDPGFGQAGEVKTSLALCQVPKLRGQKMDWFAQQRIKGAHCAVGKIKRIHSRKVKRRRIISERPRPGTVHVEGTKVKLVVSSGRR